jgi:hypothetical protein
MLLHFTLCNRWDGTESFQQLRRPKPMSPTPKDGGLVGC